MHHRARRAYTHWILWCSWLLFLGILSLINSGCSRIALLDDRQLALPTSPLFENCQRWAVVVSDYTIMHREPELAAPVLQVVRQFDLAAVLNRSDYRADHYDNYAYWYQIATPLHSGWVFGGDINLYCYQHTALLAIAAARNL